MPDQRAGFLTRTDSAHAPLADIALRPRESSPRNCPLNVIQAKRRHGCAMISTDFTDRSRDRKPIVDQVNPDPTKNEGAHAYDAEAWFVDCGEGAPRPWTPRVARLLARSTIADEMAVASKDAGRSGQKPVHLSRD